MKYDRMTSGTTAGSHEPVARDSGGTTAGSLPLSATAEESRGKRQVKKPSFVVHSYPVYIADWRDSETRMRLNMEAKGLLWELIFYAGKEGSLPTDRESLIKISGATPKEFDRSWPSVKDCFSEFEGRLHHHKVDETLESMESYKLRQQESGRVGAKTRWRKHGEPIATPLNPDSKSIAASASASASAIPNIPLGAEIVPVRIGGKDFEHGCFDLWEFFREQYGKVSNVPDDLFQKFPSYVNGERWQLLKENLPLWVSTERYQRYAPSAAKFLKEGTFLKPPPATWNRIESPEPESSPEEQAEKTRVALESYNRHRATKGLPPVEKFG